MLKKKELDTRTVTVDEAQYTVSAMTVHKRTAFEAVIVEHGQEYMREALLVFCVVIAETGVPLFPRDYYLEGEGEDAEKLALKKLIDDVAEYPSPQVEPLVTAAMQVNGLLGNDSPQS